MLEIERGILRRWLPGFRCRLGLALVLERLLAVFETIKPRARRGDDPLRLGGRCPVACGGERGIVSFGLVKSGLLGGNRGQHRVVLRVLAVAALAVQFFLALAGLATRFIAFALRGALHFLCMLLRIQGLLQRIVFDTRFWLGLRLRLHGRRDFKLYLGLA